MPPNPTTQIAGIEPTYSTREAAAILGRSYSWLDQRLRREEFAVPDGSVLRPFRAANGYRFFSTQALREIAMCCYRRRWYSYDELKSVLRQLAMDVHCASTDHRFQTKGVSRSVGVC